MTPKACSLTLWLPVLLFYPGIAKGDVADLQASVKAFGEAVIGKTPADLQDSANALIAKFNADLANAAAAYASD